MSKCGDGISFQLFLAHSLGPLHSGLNGIRNLSFPSHHFPGLSGLIVSLQKAKSKFWLFDMYVSNECIYLYTYFLYGEKYLFHSHPLVMVIWVPFLHCSSCCSFLVSRVTVSLGILEKNKTTCSVTSLWLFVPFPSE